ncbi:hypothetical protein [Staphylococcus epidermidis]|uniref:hypothetical protein n=1 Tax=Staphylococcus epidermidis TaxID=1282 RepID=UPI0016430033|nr:hypothetical protein [Staphylococcus epidermidis]
MDGKVSMMFGFGLIEGGVELLMLMDLSEGKDGGLEWLKVMFGIMISLVSVMGR